jgi:hypothetical protein
MFIKKKFIFVVLRFFFIQVYRNDQFMVFFLFFWLKLPFMIIIIFYLENNNSNNKIYHCQDKKYIYMNKKLKFLIKEIYVFSLIQFIRIFKIFILIFICFYSINHAYSKDMLLSRKKNDWEKTIWTKIDSFLSKISITVFLYKYLF